MNEKEIFISLVDNDYLKISDAIVLLEGDGINRINKVVELFNLGYSNNIIISGEIDNPGYGSFTFEKIFPFLIDKGIPKEAIIHENTSTNTREQAIEVIKLVKKNGWNKIILVASNYHQYRAYLTFLKVIHDQKLEIIIYNAPARELKWFEETGWGKRIDLLKNEFQKIIEYSKLHHIASYHSAIDYQKWKEEQI